VERIYCNSSVTDNQSGDSYSKAVEVDDATNSQGAAIWFALNVRGWSQHNHERLKIVHPENFQKCSSMPSGTSAATRRAPITGRLMCAAFTGRSRGA
jgi:hypothetical protein